jgi:prepilin peptidase CpaA
MDPVIAVIVLLTSAAGCVTDLRTRRIPNVLTFGAAVLAVVFQAAQHGSAGAVAATTGWVTAAAIFFLPFALGGLGAGDVKLLAALGAWLGPAAAIWLAIYTAIAGGAIALVVAGTHRYLRQAIANIWLLLMHWRVRGLVAHPDFSIETSGGPRLAYGVAILTGTVVTVWLR